MSAANMNTGKFNQSVEIRVFAGSADLASQNVGFLFFGGNGGLYRVQFLCQPLYYPFPFLFHSHHLEVDKYCTFINEIQNATCPQFDL